MEDKRGLIKLGRRDTLQLIGAGLVATTFVALEACKQGNESPEGTQPSAPTPPAASPPASPAAPTEPSGSGAANGAVGTCDSPIDAASKTSRKVMQYKDPAAIPEKHCSACSQFNPGAYGECGGCKLFSGPVKPLAGCLSFAPKAGATPPT